MFVTVNVAVYAPLSGGTKLKLTPFPPATTSPAAFVTDQTGSKVTSGNPGSRNEPNSRIGLPSKPEPPIPAETCRGLTLLTRNGNTALGVAAMSSSMTVTVIVYNPL